MVLKGHFDGERVVLDEPVPPDIPPQTPVKVMFEHPEREHVLARIARLPFRTTSCRPIIPSSMNITSRAPRANEGCVCGHLVSHRPFADERCPSQTRVGLAERESGDTIPISILFANVRVSRTRPGGPPLALRAVGARLFAASRLRLPDDGPLRRGKVRNERPGGRASLRD